MSRTEGFDDLAHRLMNARQAERLVPYRDLRTAEWSPETQRCHENVDWWVAHHADHAPVRGWLVFDFARASTGLIGIVRFTAHSVLQGPDQVLVDITPSPAVGRYPFVAHPGSPQEFAEFVSLRGFVFVDCHKSMS